MKVGPLFTDAIHTEDLSGRRHAQIFEAQNKVRRYLFPALICLFGVVLLGRLLFLQIIQGTYYRSLSDNNRIRTTTIHAPRGIIFDRNSIPLVYNIPGFRKVVGDKVEILDNATGITLLSQNDKTLEVDSLRKYPFTDSLSHVIGYIGQISPDELKKPQFQGYLSSDLVGKMGIEKEYEGMLKGIDGKTLSEVDATGKPIRKLGTTDPIPGQNITLTIDSKFQQTVYTAMQGVQKGAAIVSTPKGEILAMVSKPSFDPNLFTMGAAYQVGSSSAYPTVSSVLLDNQSQPVLNRAISGVYPPGSTFKLITAAAGLEGNIVDENFTITDTGVIKVGDFSFANWYYTQYGKTEGQVNITKAIQRSNDIYFYTVGNLLGVDRLSAFAEKFGLGHILGIDLPGEDSGLVPTKEWKLSVVGDKWYLGDDYHYGIGQGYLLTTPLQVNAWTQAIANKGMLYQPHLLMSKNNNTLSKGLLSEKNFALIKQGMVEACNTGGVAWPLFNYKIPVACKTGTAQHGDENTLPHAWITFFAPADNPQIIVTVLSESSGEGSNVAGPIAKQILDAYFGK